MTPLSWIYMITVWAAIVILNVFCFYKVFRKPRIEPVEETPEDKTRTQA